TAGLPFVRVDTAAPYKKTPLTSWIEDCAAWCAGGWRDGRPRLRDLIARWIAFHPQSLTDQDRHAAGVRLTELLWWVRTDDGLAVPFVALLRSALIDDLLRASPSLSDQGEQVKRLSEALADDGPLAGFQMRELGRQDGSPDHLNLLTFHSAKGCEYDVVI